MRLPATLLDLRACPAFVVRQLTRHVVLREIDLPDRLPLVRRWEIKEERAQGEAPTQLWR